MLTNQKKSTKDKWEFYDILSDHFNQLKAKLYNVIEVNDNHEKQQEAQKGLIRGFCNEHYKNAVSDIESWLRNIGIELDYDLEKGWEKEEAEPLEQ